MGKNRQIERIISSVKDNRHARIIMFTGARQVGKTTLAKQVSPEYEQLSIEDPILRYLRLSHQVIILPAWERNAAKRLVPPPKVHFMDNGVLQAILQKRGGLTGSEFESLIIADIYKQVKNLQTDASFHHLRTQDGKETHHFSDKVTAVHAAMFLGQVCEIERPSLLHLRHSNWLSSSWSAASE